MRLTVADSKIKKRNLVLINNDTHQRETLSERPIRPPLMVQNGLELNKWLKKVIFCPSKTKVTILAKVLHTKEKW